ncbi:MAG: winged helix-turn-helix domain-containing protein [Thaumarchaeota archaeon]|jgi:DNA-binding Lrp family transcriptional regulator|nr:winged helix-turn-helix domain-containing protein [Nitrososphaerota archaeon]
MTNEPSGVLLKAFKNPTKLAIIALLMKNGQMTVTQLSKLTNTTRPNLYRSIKELVKDGVILKPRIKVKKNYVEKYYELNLKIFDSVKTSHMMKAIGRAPASDLRELMISFLFMNSLLSGVFAEQIKMASDDEVESYRQKILDESILMSYSTLSVNEIKTFSKYFDQFINQLENKEKTNEKEEHMLVVLSLPLH